MVAGFTVAPVMLNGCNCCNHCQSCGCLCAADGFSIEGFISDHCQSNSAAEQGVRTLASYIVSALNLAHPLVMDCGVPLAENQFQIVGKLGQRWNADRLFAPARYFEIRNTDKHVQADLERTGRYRKVKDLVACYMEHSGLPGLNAMVTHQQVQVADVYADASECFGDYDIGHLITGSVDLGQITCKCQVWCQIERFVEYLGDSVAGSHLIHVSFAGQRRRYAPPGTSGMDDFRRYAVYGRTDKTW
jgi:hypothetical protein